MKTTIHTPLAALAAFTLITVHAHATPGGLDPTFGTGGTVTTEFIGFQTFANGVVVQPDGIIVAAGYANAEGDNDFALAFYNPDGSPAPTSTGSSTFVTPIGFDGDVGRAVALQPDGKILVAGDAEQGFDNYFALARFNTHGTLDATFNGTGVVTTQFGSDSAIASGIAIQPDGRIILAGNATIGGFAVARYNTNGTLDTTFDFDGKAAVNAGGTFSIGAKVALQADGKIVVAGIAYNGSDYDFALVRFNANGAADATFGGGGKVTTPVAASMSDRATGVAIQADGKIVVGGYSGVGISLDFALVRYNTDGSLDATFGASGKVVTPVGSGWDQAEAVAVQADGKIVLAGYSYDGNQPEFAVLRYKSNGALDASFGTGGRTTTAIGSVLNRAYAIALQADGRILLAGQVFVGSTSNYGLVRYNVALPDTRLGTTPAAPIGDNRYNLTGTGQTLNTAILHGGGVKTDFIRIQNDGPVLESFKVKGTPGNAKFAVKYLRGTTNVTSQIVAGTFNTGKLAPGGSKILKAVITAKTPQAAQKHSIFIKSTAASDASGQDTALIKARSN